MDCGPTPAGAASSLTKTCGSTGGAMSESLEKKEPYGKNVSVTDAMSASMTSAWTLVSVPHATSASARTRSPQGGRAALGRETTAREGSDDQQQHDAADGGHDDAPDVQPRRADVAESVEQPAADDGAEHADDEVAEHAAGALPRNHCFGEEAGDDADDDPCDDIHLMTPLLLRKRYYSLIRRRGVRQTADAGRIAALMNVSAVGRSGKKRKTLSMPLIANTREICALVSTIATSPR